MVTDLSQRQEMVGDLFAPANGGGDETRYALDEEQIRFFEDNGYLAGIDILTERQIDGLLEELGRLMDPSHPRHELFHEFHLNESGDPDSVLFHALGAWRIEPGFHDLIWNPALTVPARALIGGPLRFWHDQLFCKPAHHGGVVAWHQDYSYWTRTQPMAHLTCWIGLDDATRENGCLAYLPGSHKWDLLPITGLAGDMEAIDRVLTEEQREAFKHPAYVELKRGQGVFHHPLMVHGSEKNETDRPRRGAVVNFMRDGVRSAADESLLKGAPLIPKGEKMDGPFFPLLRK